MYRSTKINKNGDLLSKILEAKFSYANIFFGNLNKIQTLQKELKNALKKTGLRVVYPKVSTKDLWIKINKKNNK